jgi:hypothetical protein
MKNPVNVHQDYGDWHPIMDVMFHDYGPKSFESIWEINEWFGDMWRDENLLFHNEGLLDEIVYHSPAAVIRGHNYWQGSLMFDARSKAVYSGNEMIKSRQSPMTYISDADLGFRIVRNR